MDAKKGCIMKKMQETQCGGKSSEKADEYYGRDTKDSTLLQPDLRRGLTSEQVRQRKKDGLLNEQEDKNSKSIKQIVRDNLMTFFNLINIILAGLVIFVGSFKNLLFMGIVICNTGIGIFQEYGPRRHWTSCP